MLARLPIKVSAPLLIGLPVLIVGLWLSGMWNRQSRNAINEFADQSLSEINKLVTTRVDDVLSMPMRICEVNEHLIRSGVLDPSDLHSWRGTLVEQAQAFDMLSAISWGAADGRTAWISRYADGSYYWAVKDDPTGKPMLEWRLDDLGDIPQEPTNSFDFDLSSRPWFRTPRDAGEPVWSEPFLWVGGEEITLGLSFGIPIYNDQSDLIGIIDADFSLNDLSDFLRTIQIGKSGTVLLVDSQSRLLASATDTPIVTPDGERIGIDESTSPLIAAAASLQSGQNTELLDHSKIRVADEVFFLRQSRVGTDVGLKWRLITIVPESDFLSGIDNEFRKSSLLSLLAVLFAVGVGLLAARWLVSPLIQLVGAVRRIGEGDLDTRVDIRHAPEYTKLAHEINEMTIGLKDRSRMRESLALAREVQKNLLPAETPSIKGLDIAGHSTYCDETGGDYYDFLDVSGGDHNEVVVALGDVMGHGVAAAMLMATARGILRSRCAIPGSLADFLSHLNQLLVPDTKGEKFMTMLLVTIATDTHELRWASAGHGAPIIYNTNTDEFLDITGGGLPLGLVGEATYKEYNLSNITPGHMIITATDGLWEAKDPNGKLYGMERLQELIRKHAHEPAEQISIAFREALIRYSGPDGQDDDLTFVIAKVITE
ncbi:MAG: SpoIIE family protein phosphatase [Phycisphaerales bacterium]|nr:SpoIIE family protein phosphatase [Phycisphaerales bacterium]